MSYLACLSGYPFQSFSYHCIKQTGQTNPADMLEQPLYQNAVVSPLKASLSSREPTARENPSSTFKGYSWPQDNRLHRRRTARLTTVSPVSVIRSNLASNGRKEAP